MKYTVVVMVLLVGLLNYTPTDIYAKSLVEHIKKESYPHPISQILRFVGCVKGEISIVPTSESFEHFLIIATMLNEECFKKISSDMEEKQNYSKKTIGQFSSKMNFEWKTSKNGDRNYKAAKIESPFYLGPNSSYMEESIIAVDDNYYFLSYGNDFGVSGELVNKNLILFSVMMATHTRNIIYHIEQESLTELPNGDIEFHDEYILMKLQKSYFKGGGAFWFDSKLDYSGKVLEYIEHTGEDFCHPKEKFKGTILEEFIDTSGMDTFCVSQ